MFEYTLVDFYYDFKLNINVFIMTLNQT